MILSGPAASRYGPSPRERAVSALLSLAICVLLGFMVVRMGAFAPSAPGNGSRLVAVDVTNHEADKPKQAQRTPEHHVAAASASAPVVTPPPPVPAESPLPALNLIPLTREQMASADIGRMPRRGPAAGPPAPQGGAEAAGGGDGPGGAHLYAAEWVREPTNAEMATYIPRGANTPGAWAMIACRTVDRFHVEDCREMAESPSGSGLARGLRQASWQFLVRPPRVNGQPLVGSWVRIRFDFTRTADESGDGGNSG